MKVERLLGCKMEVDRAVHEKEKAMKDVLEVSKEMLEARLEWMKMICGDG